MVRLCGWNEFSEIQWQRAFKAYVAVNHSHWVGPPFDVVKTMLEQAGKYEFHVPAMGLWTSRFRLEEREGQIHAEFLINEALSGRMREKLEQMRAEFEQLLKLS